jgi:replicative DNA helicase
MFDFEADESAPYSDKAEMSVLCCMILSETRADQAIGVLDLKHFYRPAHQMLFGVMRDMRERGEKIDEIILLERLKLVNRLEDCGGEDYLIDLIGYLPSSENCLHYAGVVKEWWARRELSALGQDALNRDVPMEEIRLRAERASMAAPTGSTPRSGLLGQFTGRARKQGTPTGFAIIDKTTTCGGLPAGQMIVIAAGTGVGKTATKLQMAKHIAQHVGPVCYATFADMAAEDLSSRMTKNLCGFSFEPSGADAEYWHEAVKLIQSLKIHIYDATELRHGRDVETFAQWFRTAHAKHRFKALFVDYAQELKTRDKKARSPLDVAECTSDAVRWLAMDTNVPIVVGSQLTVGNEKLGTSDITRGSQEWINRSGLFLKVKRLTDEQRAKEGYPFNGMEGLTVAELAKNRFGHETPRVWWQWDTSRAMYREV